MFRLIQYSLGISVTQFTFYVINSTFYVVKSTFYMANILLSISIGVKFRLQTGGKVQTEGKMQTEDCRSGVKCRLGF